ncbi:hypothetical protein [Pseudomonas sp. LB3P14]
MRDHFFDFWEAMNMHGGITKFKFFSGVLLALTATVVMPGAWAAEARALAADGADRVGAGAVAADGSDHVGAACLAYPRSGIGSDRVASLLMGGTYSDQFNNPIINQ